MRKKLKLFVIAVSCVLQLFNCNISASGGTQGGSVGDDQTGAGAGGIIQAVHLEEVATGGQSFPTTGPRAAAAAAAAAGGGAAAAGPLTLHGEIYDILHTKHNPSLPGGVIDLITQYAKTLFPIGQYTADDFCKGVAAEILGYKGDCTEVTVILQPRCSHTIILRALKSYKNTLVSLKLRGFFDGISTEDSPRSLFKVLWAQVNDILVMKLPNLRKLTFNVPFCLEAIALETCVSRVFRRSKRVVDGQIHFTFEKQYHAAAASKEDMSASVGGAAVRQSKNDNEEIDIQDVVSDDGEEEEILIRLLKVADNTPGKEIA